MRIVWTLIGLILLAMLAGWFMLRGVLEGHQNTVVLPVPPDDVELAWIHTSTNSPTWERFVIGVQRLAGEGWIIDDSQALLEETTAIPELTIAAPGGTRRVRIRWYKMSGETGAAQWMKALSQRSPAPMAVIGGGSSDRAADLARSLAEVDPAEWKGGPPLLLLTTATADGIKVNANDYRELMKFYPGRTFRFCFSNGQMARAVVECVDQTDLRPTRNFPPLQRLLALFAPGRPLEAAAALGPFLNADSPGASGAPKRFGVLWQDDPYSIDLLDKFEEVLVSAEAWGGAEPRRMLPKRVPFSVGNMNEANAGEEAAVQELLREIPTAAGERSLLVLPTVTAPARRVLHSLCGHAPMIGRSLVAVTGDAIPFNTLYRDAEIAWNVRDIPVPLAAFLHQNPVGWDAGSDKVAPLRRPGSTEDILLYQEMMRRVMQGIFPADKSVEVRKSDELRDRFRSADPPFFDAEGNRLGGQNEFVVIFRPVFLEGDRIRDEPRIEVWSRAADRRWTLISQLEKYRP